MIVEGRSLLCSVEKHNVPVKRRIDRDFRRFKGQNLSDQDDVSVLPPKRAQRRRPRSSARSVPHRHLVIPDN